MKIMPLVAVLSLMVGGLGCLESNRGTSVCKTELNYVTNQFTQGERAIHHASEYRAPLSIGSDDNPLEVIVDMNSSQLRIDNNFFETSNDTVLGNKPFVLTHDRDRIMAINAKDSLDVGCIEDFAGRFILTDKEQEAGNYLGLAYGTRKSPSFLTELASAGSINDEFSLALCSARANSWLLLGGIDSSLKPFIGNYIPIIEKSAFVVPAVNMRRADTKQVFGVFPTYDQDLRLGVKTIIDSATSFLLLPQDMAEAMAKEVSSQADALGFMPQIPDGFFRIERASSIKPVRFSSIAQIRQFPSFEITFVGADGYSKALELSPLHYLKEIDTKDPLIRIFSIRETSGDVVLGQPFLENHYAYFDRKKGRIGFAPIDLACGPQ